MALVGYVRAPYLEILTGPARAVTEQTDYGRFAYGCSQARKASLCKGPYGAHTIPKNTDNPKNARMHVAMHIEEG